MGKVKNNLILKDELAEIEERITFRTISKGVLGLEFAPEEIRGDFLDDDPEKQKEFNEEIQKGIDAYLEEVEKYNGKTQS